MSTARVVGPQGLLRPLPDVKTPKKRRTSGRLSTETVATPSFAGSSCTWGGLAYESQPFAKKVASALTLFAPLGTKLAHSARVRTIKHRHER